MRWAGGLVFAASLALVGCDGFGIIGVACTMELRPALRVHVVDSVSGAPVPEPLVWVKLGTFQDTFPAWEGMAAGPSDRERSGTYAIHVEHPDYAPWVRTDVRVTEDECHVRTRDVTARLQP